MSRLAFLLAVAAAASAQLTLDGVRCGQLACQFDEYCSPETNRCAPCTTLCNKTHHNYDSGLCMKECQGYLLDMRYMKKKEHPTPTPAYDGTYQLAQTALIVSIVSLSVMIVTLIIVCKGRFSWRSLKQKFQPAQNRVKQFPGDFTQRNPHAEMPKPKHEMKLEIRNPETTVHHPQPLNVRDLDNRTSHTEKSQGATTPKTMSTALSNRHPAEDTTLDFSYDNMAMNVTPPERPSTAQKF